MVARPTHVDQSVAKELLALGKQHDFTTVTGKTLCTDDFYEGQGRLDGAFCEYTLADKMKYLEHLRDEGVKNIEMEATAFAALTHMAGIRSAIVCVALLNRMHGDQITDTKEQMLEYQSRPQRLVASYIKKQMNVALSMVKSLNNQGRRGSALKFQTYEDETPRQQED